MNVHPDILRHSNMHPSNMHQPLDQPFSPQPSGQPPNPQNMGLLMGNSNPNYMQHAAAQRRPNVFMTHPNGTGLNTAAVGPSHMMARFPNTNGAMPQRIPSQLTGPPGMIGGGMGLTGPLQMTGMRSNPVMHPQMQQIRQQQAHQHQQQQQQPGGGMSPDMGLPMNRLPHARQPSGQPMMSTLPQQPSLAQSHGMQQQIQHGAFGNSISLPHQASQLGSSPLVGSNGQSQSGMGATMAGNQMPPQPSGNRSQMTQDNQMFMTFQNSSIPPPLSHGIRGMPINSMNGPQFNMAPSPTPLSAGDMPQRGNAPMNSQGPTNMTPAQVLDQMNSGSDFHTGSYGMGQPPVSAPPRPPSQHGPHNAYQISPPHHPFPPPQQSPRQTAMHTAAPSALQRPQSQPQVARQSPIPSATRTPRVSQPSLPMHTGGMLPPPRMPTAPGHSPRGSSQQPAQQPSSAPTSSHPVQLAPRPPNTSVAPPAGAAVPSAPSNTVPSSGQQSSPGGSQQPAATVSAPTTAPPAPPRPIMYPLGFGQGAVRLLQLSGALSAESKERLKMSYWQTLVSNYFTEKATMKLTLWKDNQQIEAKPFEIGYPIFPRFFLVTSQSGVKSQTITIDGARERITSNSHALIECPAAAWTFRYTNGYSITLRGPFTADIVVHPLPPPQTQPGPGVLPYVLKIERLQFDAFWHDKYLAFGAIQGDRIPDSPRMMPSSPGNVGNANDALQNFDSNRYDEPRYIIEHAIIPAEPINAFGIPQATMRCLELAESVAQMSDLIQFSINNKLGPVDALTAFAEKIRVEQSPNRGSGAMEGIVSNGSGPSYADGLNGASTPGASSYAIGPGPLQPTPGGEQQNASHPEGSKTKASPQAAAQGSGSTAAAQASTPASAPTPGGPTTPSMANAQLKRKARAEDSPTAAPAEQKRVNRKRGRTQGT